MYDEKVTLREFLTTILVAVIFSIVMSVVVIYIMPGVFFIIRG